MSGEEEWKKLTNEENELILFDRINIIKDTIEKFGEENFYISFSGGKDSTVVHYLVDLAIPQNKIPRVYINTGIEYIDVVRFVERMAKEDNRIVIIKNKTNIRKTLDEKGYPFKSKEHSKRVKEYQKYGMSRTSYRYLHGLRPDGTPGTFKCPECLKYQFESDFKMPVSEKCCDILKKENFNRYRKESGKEISILGVRRAEGGLRRMQTGCVLFDKKGLLKSFKPLNPVSNEWIDWFVDKYKIKLCRLYYPPFSFKRTGCKGCPFSINLQEQLEIMEKYLPSERKQCELLWKPVYGEYRRIGYRLKKNEQTKLDLDGGENEE